MFCSKCGKKVSDAIRFCPECGNMLNENMQRVSLKKHKYGFGVGIITTAVIVGFLMLLTMLKGESVEDVAIEACKAELEGDVDKYYELLAKPYKEYMVGPHSWFDDDEEFKEELADIAEDGRRRIESECGEKFKAEYKADEVEKYDDNDLRKIKRELKRDYDYESDLIEDAAVVKVRIQIHGDDSAKDLTARIYCVKIKGSWYIHRPGFE